MKKLYRMKPYERDLVWAGLRLRRELGHQAEDGLNIAEALEASGLDDMASVAVGGPDDGLSLQQIFEQDAQAFTGKKGYEDGRFPLLVKRIDAGQCLSVQVHPNDAVARELAGEPNGKSEAWVILDAEPGASVYLGFREGVSKAQIKRAMKDGTVFDYLREIPVRRGDVLPVPPGTVHAIGGGIYLFEVQQPSNLTYRIFDFDRKDNGEKRELHPDQALAALDLKSRPVPAKARPLRQDGNGKLEKLCEMSTFSIERCRAEGPFSLDVDALSVLHFVAGEALLKAGDGEQLEMAVGHTAVVPAFAGQVTVEPSAATGGACEILIATHRS